MLMSVNFSGMPPNRNSRQNSHRRFQFTDMPEPLSTSGLFVTTEIVELRELGSEGQIDATVLVAQYVGLITHLPR